MRLFTPTTVGTFTLALALVACEKEEPTPTDNCSDGEPASTFDGDVDEADVASFCEGVCARDVQGSVVLDATELTDLDDLWCLTAVSGDLYLRSNAELTSISGLSSLKTVGGNVSIGEAYCGWDPSEFTCEGHGNPALVSLDGLQNLETIGGWLWIGDDDALVDGGSFAALTSVGGAHPDERDGLLVNGNANLVQLPDFPQLTTITGQIEVTVNDSLTSLAGLEALVTHDGWFDPFLGGGFVMIHFNPALESLSGLDNLQTSGTIMLGAECPKLVDLQGLNSLTHVRGYLELWGTTLASLQGLNSLTTVDQYLSLINNDELTNFEGLNSLETVGATGVLPMGLNIMDSDALVSVDGLESLTTIGGSLQIMGLYEVGNPSLVDLTALYGVESVGEDVTITGNTALTDAAAQALVDEIGSIGGTVTISGNE